MKHRIGILTGIIQNHINMFGLISNYVLVLSDTYATSHKYIRILLKS